MTERGILQRSGQGFAGALPPSCVAIYGLRPSELSACQKDTARGSTATRSVRLLSSCRVLSPCALWHRVKEDESCAKRAFCCATSSFQCGRYSVPWPRATLYTWLELDANQTGKANSLATSGHSASLELAREADWAPEKGCLERVTQYAPSTRTSHSAGQHAPRLRCRDSQQVEPGSTPEARYEFAALATRPEPRRHQKQPHSRVPDGVWTDSLGRSETPGSSVPFGSTFEHLPCFQAKLQQLEKTFLKLCVCTKQRLSCVPLLSKQLYVQRPGSAHQVHIRPS